MYVSNLLALLPFVAVASATVNGHCTGQYATGTWGEDGICISTTECNDYNGQYTNNACPDDGPSIKCCVVGAYPDSAVNPCGGVSVCEWLDTNGKCPGGQNPIRSKSNLVQRGID
jgi:hypothetical protein